MRPMLEKAHRLLYSCRQTGFARNPSSFLSVSLAILGVKGYNRNRVDRRFQMISAEAWMERFALTTSEWASCMRREREVCFVFPLSHSSYLLRFALKRQSVHCGKHDVQLGSLLRESFWIIAQRVGVVRCCYVDIEATSAKNTKSRVS